MLGLVHGAMSRVNSSALDLTGRAWYNRMLLSSAFWGSFRAPLLLLFEADTALCPAPTRPLPTFAGYGYVGAPWAPYAGGWFPAWCRNLGTCVGNSGLSLWSRLVMENLTARPPSHYEGTVASYLTKSRGSASKFGYGSSKALYSGKGNLSRSKLAFTDSLVVSAPERNAGTAAHRTPHPHAPRTIRA